MSDGLESPVLWCVAIV